MIGQGWCYGYVLSDTSVTQTVIYEDIAKQAGKQGQKFQLLQGVA